MTNTTHNATLHELVCANHPDRETNLRCNRCEKPICASCVVQTPTGYRCEECVRGRQKVFETAEVQDYVVAILLASGLSFLGSLLVPRFGFFTIFLAPGAGAIIAELIRRAINRRRAKRLFQWTAAAVAVGGLLTSCLSLLGIFLATFVDDISGGLGLFSFGLIWQVVYAFFATSTVYYRLSGIRL